MFGGGTLKPRRVSECGIVGDEVEQEVTGDTANAAMLGFSQGSVLFAPSEDALDHRATGLRFGITRMSGRASVDGTAPPSAGLGQSVVLGHVRGDIGGTQPRHVDRSCRRPCPRLP